MNDPGIRRELAQAVLASSAVPVEGCGRTKETVIMQSLHYGKVLGFRRVVSGRRNKRKRIVKMYDIRPPAPNAIAETTVARSIPDGGYPKTQTAQLRNLIVVQYVTDDFMSARFQQMRFSGEDLVLASGLLVVVVDDKNAHGFTADVYQ
jgi:hypothetical protein